VAGVHEPPFRRSRRAFLGTIALSFALISGVALVLIWIDVAVRSDEEGGLLEGILFACLELGWVLAALFGVAAWVRGALTRRRDNVRAGQIALGYVLLAFLLALIIIASHMQ